MRNSRAPKPTPGSSPLAGMKDSPGRGHLLDSLRRIGVQGPEVLELFDYIEDVLLWMKDTQGCYKWINLPFLINYGVQTRAEVLGRTDMDLSSPALATQYRLDDECVLRGKCILSRVELVGRFDHTARWCLTSKVPLHDASGSIAGTAGVACPLKGQPAAVAAPLSPAIHFISEHYGQPITNHKLADLCGMSVRAFERHFRALYRVSPHVFVRQVRVRMSCSRLVFSKKSLAVVASEVGFADQSHFAREFRQFLGESPSAYRARYTQR
jgi:AraC-like DNA-binding protein